MKCQRTWHEQCFSFERDLKFKLCIKLVFLYTIISRCTFNKALKHFILVNVRFQTVFLDYGVVMFMICVGIQFHMPKYSHSVVTGIKLT